MLKIKCDINQQYLKTVDLHFVKSEYFSLTWSCGSRQRDTTSSGWKFRLNYLAVKGLREGIHMWRTQAIILCALLNCAYFLHIVILVNKWKPPHCHRVITFLLKPDKRVITFKLNHHSQWLSHHDDIFYDLQWQRMRDVGPKSRGCKH